MNDYTAFYGGEVKALGNGKVGGYLVRFSDPGRPDLEGDYFDAATDFGEIKSSPVYYQHGLDKTLKTRRIGRAELRQDEFGIWAEAQLELRDRYEQFIYELAEAGKMGWSSGTAAHLVEREAVGEVSHIRFWPLGLDASLTPTPAEPRNAAYPVKSIQPVEIETLIPAEAAQVEAIHAEADNLQDKIPATVREPIQPTEVIMDDNTTPDVSTEAIKAQLAAMSERLEHVLKTIEEQPALERAGYLTNDGGRADAGHKSFGDWLLAVARKDTTRLAKVYGSYKDLGKDQGSAGGYLVPNEYMAPLLQISVEQSPIVSRVTRVPVNAGSGSWPALDYSVTPTAGSGQTALAAGLSAVVTEENVAMTEDQPGFRELTWRLQKVGGYTEVSNELIQSSPLAIETLLTNLFGVTVASLNERNIIRGSGAGHPLGILNAACTVAVATASDNVFGEADSLSMLSRFKRLSLQQPVWIMHPGVIPDLAAFVDSSYTPLVNFATGVGPALLGYPIIYSEHMPQANGDDVILADLGAYLWFQRGGLEVDFSEHAGFTSYKGTWRFAEHVDGMPWLSAAITLADPTGSYTVSPFCYHDD